MPTAAHEVAHRYFTDILRNAAIRLTTQVLPSFGYKSRGSQGEGHCFPLCLFGLIVLLAYLLIDDGRKEADECIVPNGSLSPSIVVEVGCSETITQLQGDAKRWLESTRVDVCQFYFTLLIVVSHRYFPG